MAVPQEEHERTSHSLKLRLVSSRPRSAGQPRNFEIWYHYATGYNQPLNQAINETLAKKGALSDADLDQIYGGYIAESRSGERIDSVGSRVLDEINM